MYNNVDGLTRRQKLVFSAVEDGRVRLAHNSFDRPCRSYEPVNVIEIEDPDFMHHAIMREHGIRALRVTGDTTAADNVLAGDCLIVEDRNAARDGELVLVRVKRGELGLKRFFRQGSSIRLEGTGPGKGSFMLDERDIMVQAVVTGILRKFRG